jgi:excisionase family DNA binding protein
MSTTTLPPIMTIGEAARYSGLHRDRVSAAIHRGDLQSREIEGRRFIVLGEFTAWCDRLGLPMSGVWK